MNMVTKAYFLAIAIDCLMYAACFAYETPRMSCGFVWCPYSVTQIGTVLRLNNLFRFASSCGSEPSVMFGQRTFCDGFRFGVNGYGWCDQASNLSLGFALASSSTNLPGEWTGRTPFGLSVPRAEVSPIATSARGLPALMPEYPAAK